MEILKNIGALFVRLWRWVRETAWVQPLLIVGTIFGVIFSIPNFTAWFSALGVGSHSGYYISKKQSLEGEVIGTEITSAADKLTAAMNKGSNFDKAFDENEYAEFKASIQKDVIDVYGEKFYVVYVKEDCSNCDTISEAFQTLENGWGTSFVTEDNRPFKLYTIFSDDSSSNDNEYEVESDKKAFNRYLVKFSNNGFFENAGGRLQELPYAITNKLGDSADYKHFIEADRVNFAVPAVLLVDFSKESWELEISRPGVAEVLFGVTGDGSIEKADLLMQMWNHTSKTDITNKFSDYYQKTA